MVDTWPWQDENYKLLQNYELSMGRLKSLHKRLMDNPILLQMYDEIIQSQLEKGMIEVVNEHTKQGKEGPKSHTML